MTKPDKPTKRAYGTGSVREKHGVWWIRYPDGRGNRVEESSESKKRQVPERLLAKRLGEVQSGKYQGPEATRLGFEDLETMLVNHYRGKRSETRAVGKVNDQGKRGGGALANLRRHLGLYLARNITLDVLTEYRNGRFDEGAAPATVKYELAMIRKAFNVAVRAGKLDRRPPLPEVTVENTRKEFFEEKDFDRLLGELPDRHRGWARFAYLTGWRSRAEVLTRQWKHVDWQAGTIRLEPGETKNGRGRTFPFSALPELKQVLESQWEYTTQCQRRTGQKVEWVFHRTGNPIKNYYSAWHAACARAKLTDRIPHDFRRTAVRALVRSGIPEQMAMELTGHETRSVFDRYDIVNEEDLKNAVEKLAATRQIAKQRAKEQAEQDKSKIDSLLNSV